MSQKDEDSRFMSRALQLAAQGQGFVEPNPMVGCVIVANGQIVGEGWHSAFGQAHAEVEALRAVGDRARGATMYVTLEPCCHHGKTPPCTKAIIAAGIGQVVAAMEDPFDQVAGGGFRELEAAGIPVRTGPLEHAARELNAPFLKLRSTGRPWIIAKWAMSLDGKIATRTGDSKWISGETARLLVHKLRGRVDAIMVGSGTAIKDDPLLTARPLGPRIATRVVVDSKIQLPLDSQLVQTAGQIPLIVAVAADSNPVAAELLSAKGCQLFPFTGNDHRDRLEQLLEQLGGKHFTNVLVEGGGQLLGALFDMNQIDEIHVFVAPQLIGGGQAVTPLAGIGLETISNSVKLDQVLIENTGDDIYVSGRVRSMSP